MPVAGYSTAGWRWDGQQLETSTALTAQEQEQQSLAARVAQILSPIRSWVAYLALFLISFLPRAAAVGAYTTVDEQRWIERSVDFVYNLTHGDLASIASIHPGVTATWGFGSFLLSRFLLQGDPSALYQMRADNSYDLPDLLPTAGMFTVLLTSLTVVVSYWLLKKLFRGEIAFLAGLLIALDPYYLAHSRRVHIDALLASFMFLAALSLLAYISQGGGAPRRYLLLSGLFAGLGWLTKLPALYLVPYTLLAMGVQLVSLRQDQRVDASALWSATKGFLLWIAVACLVFFVLWPSLWVNPAGVLAELSHVLSWGVEAPHTSLQSADPAPMQFFLGEIVRDPGAGYYPLVGLFRLSPVTMLLFVAGIAALVHPRIRKGFRGAEIMTAWLGVAYVLFFVVMMSLAAKKLESYILPVFPMVEVLAAIGLMACLRWLASKWQQRRSGEGESPTRSIGYGLAVVGIILVSFLWLRLAPYYSAYFNPLLGGPKVASRLLAFGGGEGLDMAAQYLNQKEGAKDLVVAAAYPEHVFRHHFEGATWPLRQGNWTGLWLLSDYVVSYLSYEQRDLPSAEVVDFLHGLEPEWVARINGIEYARVYKVPPLVRDDVPPISHPADVNLGDRVTFLGYDLDTEQVESGGELRVTLYWQRRQPLETDYSVYLRLINGARDVWGSQDGGPLAGAMPTSLWDEGMVIADKRRFQILPGTPPGSYQIATGIYDAETMDHLEPLGSEDELLLGPVEVVRGLAGGLPSPQHEQEANLGDQVRLLGYDLGGEPRPGGTLELTLFWETLSPMEDDYTVFLHLVDTDGKIWGQRDSQPVTGFYPTSLWAPGEYVLDQYKLTIAENAPPGEYALSVGMYHPDTSARLPVVGRGGKVKGDHVPLESVQVHGP